MNFPKIKICPIIHLIDIIKTQNTDSIAAVLSSSYEMVDEIYNLHDFLFLNYDDVDTEIPARSMTLKDSERAADFIKSHRNFDGTLYFCCDSGMSRSSAIACAAIRYFNSDDMPVWENPHYSPNALVYEMMCSSLGVDLKEYELDYRISRNHKALKNAISKHR